MTNLHCSAFKNLKMPKVSVTSWYVTSSTWEYSTTAMLFQSFLELGYIEKFYRLHQCANHGSWNYSKAILIPYENRYYREKRKHPCNSNDQRLRNFVSSIYYSCIKPWIQRSYHKLITLQTIFIIKLWKILTPDLCNLNSDMIIHNLSSKVLFADEKIYYY